MRFLSLLIILIATASLSIAQDIHLTQYYTNNQLLNPAYTGNYTGDYKAIINYRSQWAQVNSAIKTSVVSIEKNLTKFNRGFAAGLIVNKDYVSSYHLNTNRFYLSGSYTTEIKQNIIRVGLQAGGLYRSINYSDQTFPDQWDYNSGNFDKSIESGEPNTNNSKAFADVNAGVAYIRKFGNKKISAGYGAFHINRPKYGFINNDEKLAMRHVGNAALTFYMKNGYSVVPNFLYMRSAKATDFIVATNAYKKINNELILMLGAGYRGSTNSDAFLAILGLQYKRFEFGFSTDFNVSELSKETKNKNAFEFSLTYTTPSRFGSKATIPCDRY
ncbi:PorP/SprF family type IX secretion system membrane protein [Sporocytophaga myxococcoides]|uniref:PorP/SprF family type IX secretion system membrane protein n=1 Tax=Sporocytophaga myxococcoides TaxID=153721 RepID=UPI000404A780|nr:PorP/SprF family type IX secretion system membrane protein [Sporocytophaga myxococcoides]